MRFIKTLIIRIAIALLGISKRFLPLGFTEKLLLPFAKTPLRHMVYNIWSRILLYSGHRLRRARFSKLYWKHSYVLKHKSRDSAFGLNYVLDSLRIGATDCGKFLGKMSENIYQNNESKNYIPLQTVRAIYEIETEKELGKNKYVITGQKLAADYFRFRMERAHAMRKDADIKLYAHAYAASISYNPFLICRVCDKTLTPNGLHEAAIEMLQTTHSKVLFKKNKIAEIPQEETPSGHLVQGMNMILRLMQKQDNADLTYEDDEKLVEYHIANQFLELEQFDRVEEIIAKYPKEENFALLRSKLLQITEKLTESSSLKQSLIDGATKKNVTQGGLADLAEVLEEQKRFDDALTLYRSAYTFDHDDSLNIARNSSWRYVHALLSNGLWAEGRAVLRESQVYMWQFFKPYLRRKSDIKRLEQRDYRLPKRGGLILGCWGIGDEFFRMGIWNQIADKKQKWGLTCEPRLESVFRRSFPDMNIIVNSRVSGSHSIGEETYWKDREGLPANTDLARITLDSLEGVQKFRNTILSETLLYEFVCRKGEVPNPPNPAPLTTDPVEIERVQAWLDTLPEGLNVGISWRSGKRSASRNKSYTELIEWADIMSLKNINFINLQYSDSVEEKDEVRDAYDVEIHEMPGVSRKDDIETLLAICQLCDVVIAPCTAVREMSAAVGANTWSLTVTPFLPDLWRIAEDGKTDLFFPDMRHFTINEFGSKQGVLTAMADALSEYPGVQSSGKGRAKKRR